MLKILNEDKRRSKSDIERQYPQCKYIWIINDIADTEGRLYAVSDDLESSHDMYLEAERIRKSGEECVVCGRYSGGTISGVQFVFE